MDIRHYTSAALVGAGIPFAIGAMLLSLQHKQEKRTLQPIKLEVKTVTLDEAAKLQAEFNEKAAKLRAEHRQQVEKLRAEKDLQLMEEITRLSRKIEKPAPVPLPIPKAIVAAAAEAAQNIGGIKLPQQKPVLQNKPDPQPVEKRESRYIRRAKTPQERAAAVDAYNRLQNSKRAYNPGINARRNRNMNTMREIYESQF